MKTTLLAATLLATVTAAFASSARADKPDPRLNKLYQAVRAAGNPGRAGQDGVKRCLAEYDKLIAAGVPDSTPMSHAAIGSLPEGTNTIKEVHDACAGAGSTGDLKSKEDDLHRTASILLQDLKSMKTTADLQTIGALAEKCSRQVDEGLAAGIPRDYAIAIGDTGSNIPWKGTIATMKAEVCDKAAAAAKQTGADRVAPYIAAGMKADKLDMVTKNGGATLYQIAGGESTLDAAKLVQANVWFLAYDGGPCASGAATRLERFQFDAAQKLVKTTSHDYCGTVPKSAYH